MSTQLNQFKSNNFKFMIKRAPTVAFYLKTINLPGIQLGSSDFDSALTKAPIPGDKLTYNELSIEFILDENLNNYFEIADWIKAIGFETAYDEYKTLLSTDGSPYTDATLIITSNQSNPKLEIAFEELFPVSIDDIPLTSAEDNVILVSATFRFRRWNKKVII